MDDFLISGGLVFTMDKERRVLENGAIAIKDNLITDVGEAGDVASRRKARVEVDASGRVVLPGLVNAHNHLYGLLTRYMPLTMEGINPLDFGDSLTRWWWPKIEETCIKEDAYVGSLMGCAEMALAGITTSADTLEAPNTLPGGLDEVARAFREVGLRGVLCFESSERLGARFGDRGIEENLRFIRQCRSGGDRFVRGSMGVHTAFSSSPAFLRRVREAAHEAEVPIQIHIAQSRYEVEFIERYMGRPGPVHLLDEVGFLGPEVVAAHCIYLSEEEINILAERGVNISFNAKSNQRAANGVAPVTEFLNRGMNVALGLDGINIMDMFELMVHSAYLLRVHHKDRRLIPARQALEMATLNGAKALGLDDEIGSIEPGKKADLIMVTLKERVHLWPAFNYWEVLASGARAGDVEWVMVDGRVIVEQGRLKTVEPARLFERVRDQALEYKARIEAAPVAKEFRLETL